MEASINPLLENIYEQPGELARVLDDLTGPRLDRVRQISHLLRSANEVILSSMGSAFYSLMPMYEMLRAQGRRRVALEETADLLHYPERLSRDAVYVLMSRSGESREVADFSRYLNENGFLSVAITMTPGSTMGRNCTYVLHDIASYDKIVCIKAYSSMALCGLVCAHMTEHGEPDRRLLDSLYGAFSWMEKEKENILGQIRSIPCLKKADSFYLLSRGYGINMMRSCSLWIEETAKIPSPVMSIDNFYHGPMEIIRSHAIVKSVTVPIFLDTLPDSRSEMIWNHVNRAVPESVYFGPEGSGAPGGARILYPDLGLPGSCMTLVQALYFQLLSYQCAAANGIEPGMFFDEGWVVT